MTVPLRDAAPVLSLDQLAAWRRAVLTRPGHTWSGGLMPAVAGTLIGLSDETGTVVLHAGNLYRLFTRANVQPPAARNLLHLLRVEGLLVTVEPEADADGGEGGLHWGTVRLVVPADE